MTSYDSTPYDSFYIGAFNDSENLYLCLTTASRDLQAQLMGMADQSLTIWLDPYGQKSKVLGLKFSGNMKGNEKEQSGNIGKQEQMMMNRSFGDPGKNIKVEVMENSNIVGSLDEIKGIETVVAMAGSKWEMICELKIPLKSSDEIKYALRALPGTTLGILFEAERIKGGMGTPPNGKMGKGEGGPPSGGGPKGGMGGPGGPEGMGGKESLEKISVFGRIILANKPS